MRKQEYLADLAERGPVASQGEDGDWNAAMADCYFAANNGLEAMLQGKRGGKEKLAYIIRRIDQWREAQ